MTSASCDVLVVGSGFAGSILARVLNRQGRRVILVERGRHPRFALGESATPLAALSLERLAATYDLPDLAWLATHGRWLRHLPHLGRGLKRGFTFFHHRPGERFVVGAQGEGRLLVAASPDDEVADCHWVRADVDHHLVRRAQAEGVEVLESTRLESFEVGPVGARVRGQGPQGALEIHTAFVVDATGPGGFLARAFGLPPAPVRRWRRRPARLLYAHLGGLPDFAPLVRHEVPGWVEGPYPDDRAAVHHLIEEGWVYVLPFDPSPAGERVASVGAVLHGGGPALPAEPRRAWDELLGRYPSLAAQLGGAAFATQLAEVQGLRHRLAAAVGERWLLLPHAFAFFDPLFSTGMAWSLVAVERVAALLATSRSPPAADLAWYGAMLEREADQIELLLAGAYLAMPEPRLFAAQAALYFAAVSFAELGQRLLDGGGFFRDGFLGASDPVSRGFLAQGRQRLAALRRTHGRTIPAAAVAAHERWVAEVIRPRNLIGLADPSRGGLYPVDLEVLRERMGLLGLSREAFDSRLDRLRGHGPSC